MPSEYLFIAFIVAGFLGGMAFGFYGGCSMLNGRLRDLLKKVDNFDPTKNN